MNDHTIVIDSREPKDIQDKYMTAFDFGTVEELPVGDFAILDKSVLVERKEYADLVQSVYSGHLEKQLQELSTAAENGWLCVVMVVGTCKSYNEARFVKGGAYIKSHNRPNKPGWTVENHLGLVISKAIQYPNVRWVFVDNHSQMVCALRKLAEKAGSKPKGIDSTELMRLEKVDGDSVEDTWVRMLTAIPGFGATSARAIVNSLNAVKSESGVVNPILELACMSEENLAELPGVGKVAAKKIRSVFAGGVSP